MSRIDELHETYCLADKSYMNSNGGALIWDAERAGIAAVIRALRDEFTKLGTLESQDSWEVLRKFNEILGDAGEKVAGGLSRLEREAKAGSASSPAPATTPAPAVCVWTLLERKQGIATWSSDHRWHAFFTYEKAPLLCDECGLPIKFTETKT